MCALWVPRAKIMNTLHMEPIAVQAALKSSQQLAPPHTPRVCSLCKLAHGCVVPCSADECGTYFHPLCAWFDGLAMAVEVVEIDCRFMIYCLRHTPHKYIDALVVDDCEGELESGALHGGSGGGHSGQHQQHVQQLHLSYVDKCVLRARQQRELRHRGRAHQSEKVRERRRKRLYLERRRKERARAAREDLYEPGRCAVCFQTAEELSLIHI